MTFLSHVFLRIYDHVVLYLALFVFGLLGIFWSLPAAVLYLILPEKSGRYVGRLMIMLLFRGFLACMALSGRFRFDLHALDVLRGEKSLIIAPNHPSLWDVLLINSRLLDVTCIIKAEIIGNIFLGAGAKLAGYIRNASFRTMLKLSVKNLDQGSHLLLFPEGTRTTRAPIGPLKAGIGAIACRAKVPVQTVLIETNSPFLSKGWPVYKVPRMPVIFRVRLGRRFDAPEHGDDFMAKLEHYFASELTIPVSTLTEPVAAPVTIPSN